MSKEFVWTNDQVKAACQSLMYKYKYKEQQWTNVDTELARFKERKMPVPEWEIMSMMHERNRGDRETIFERQQDGRFKAEWWPDESFDMHDDLIKNKNGKKYLIKSVKRLSDGEVFTIGCQITSDCCTNWHKISSFRIIEETMCADFDTFHSCTKPLHKIEKVKANVPLFTTEDGVELHEGDAAWFVRPDFETGCILDIDRKPINEHYKYFSTQLMSEEYAIMNKPCLSIEEVVRAGFGCSPFRKEVLRKELKELVKKKPSVG